MAGFKKKIKEFFSPILALVGPQRQEIAEAITSLIFVFIVLGLLLGWLPSFIPEKLMEGYIFNLNMSPETALEILRGIMQLDGVLIGFVGLFAIFILTDIRRTYGDILRSDKYTHEARDKATQKLESRRSLAFWFTALAISSLVLSIGVTLRSMSYIGGTTMVDAFSYPLLFMIYGIVATLALLARGTGLKVE